MTRTEPTDKTTKRCIKGNKTSNLQKKKEVDGTREMKEPIRN